MVKPMPDRGTDPMATSIPLGRWSRPSTMAELGLHSRATDLMSTFKRSSSRTDRRGIRGTNLAVTAGPSSSGGTSPVGLVGASPRRALHSTLIESAWLPIVVSPAPAGPVVPAAAVPVYGAPLVIERLSRRDEPV